MSASNGTQLLYDPLGRLWQTSGGPWGKSQFLTDGDQLAVEYDGDTGAIRRRFMFGPGVDEPILMDEGGALDCSGSKFLHTDHQGSVIGQADCWGGLTAINRYDDWGLPQASNVGRFQYTGQMWIPELGLYHYKARAYSPVLGRFMQTDPVGYDDQVNLYAYVANDPVNGRDPTGKTCDKTDAGKYACKVDDRGSGQNKATNSQVAKIERAYTNAVNKLMKNPDQVRQIGATDGKNKVTQSVTQGAIAKALIEAKVSYGGVAPPKDRALTDKATGSVVITLYDRAVARSDPQVSQTFVHEGLHGTDEDTKAYYAWLDTKAAMEWNDAHNPTYKQIAEDVMTDD